MDLVVLGIDPSDVAFLEPGRRADGHCIVERRKVIRLDLAVEYLDDSVRVAVVVDGRAIVINPTMLNAVSVASQLQNEEVNWRGRNLRMQSRPDLKHER